MANILNRDVVRIIRVFFVWKRVQSRVQSVGCVKFGKLVNLQQYPETIDQSLNVHNKLKVLK